MLKFIFMYNVSMYCRCDECAIMANCECPEELCLGGSQDVEESNASGTCPPELNSRVTKGRSNHVILIT